MSKNLEFCDFLREDRREDFQELIGCHAVCSSAKKIEGFCRVYKGNKHWENRCDIQDQSLKSNICG